MRVVLATRDIPLAEAWQASFADTDQVSVHFGSILDHRCDAVVSPANSFGFMDGGIDLSYALRFGWQVQERLRLAIFERHQGELLVGQAEIVETGVALPAFMIAAPTMRVPMVLGKDTINPYLATRAALLLARHGTFSSGPHAGNLLSHQIETIAFPGMGTGVGRVDPRICAR